MIYMMYVFLKYIYVYSISFIPIENPDKNKHIINSFLKFTFLLFMKFIHCL